MNETRGLAVAHSHAAKPETASVSSGATAQSQGQAAVQTWNGVRIGSEIHGRALAAAYRQWLLLKPTRLPRLKDMIESMSNPSDDWLLMLRTGDDYVVVSQSESYIRNIGHDLRGSLASDLKFPTANSMKLIYDDCIAQRQPTYARYISSLSQQNVYWETLVLPLAADGGGRPIFGLSIVAPLNEKTDILQILYDRSPIGMIAAVPTMNSVNKTDDGRILTMNARARQLLRLPPDGQQLYYVGQLVPYMRENLGWTRTGTSLDGHTTRLTFDTEDGTKHSVTIELINQFILISITLVAGL
jgi:PAS domain-containing protein